MKNNIFNELQLSSLLLSLEKGDCPVKFTYITESGAQAWNQIETHRTSNWWKYTENELLKENIENYLYDMWNPKEICFFDFWCGTGKTVKWMLGKLCEKWFIIHYHAFDISENIIQLAKETIWDLWENYTFNYTVLDFETYNLTSLLVEIRKEYKNFPVIGMLLGNTLWNFDSMERIISNITEAFRMQDRLIIGIEKSEVSNEKRMTEMLAPYKNNLGFSLAFSTLELFWVARSIWEYNVLYNNSKNTVEGYFELNKDATITLWSNTVKFEKWDKIRLFKSTKMNETQFCQLILNLDLRIASMKTDCNNRLIQMLIWAKRY